MARLRQKKEIVVLAPLFLPPVGMCAPPQMNESFDSGSAHVVPSGKNNGVVTADVSRHPLLTDGPTITLSQ
jgi:hypothetical protein